MILMTNDGTCAIDLSTVVGQIVARCEQLEKQGGDLKLELDMAKIMYNTQIQSLEESVDMLKEEMATM